MNLNLSPITLTMSLVCLCFASFAQDDVEYAHDRLMGKLNTNVQLTINDQYIITLVNQDYRRLFNKLGVKQFRRFITTKPSRSIYEEPILIEFYGDINVQKVLKTLLSTDLFDYLEPDFIGTGGAICKNTPNDSHYYNRQWSMFNDGTFNGNSTVDADIDMDHAWTLTTGNPSIVISTLDAGLKLDHPEVANRIWANPGETPSNFTDDDLNGYDDDIVGWDFVNLDNDPTDDHGHGTNVTGIIAADGNNSIGYAGVDWNCQLMTCKILDNNNSGFYSWWTAGIYYSVDNGADAMNMSVGGSSFSSAMQTAVNYAYTNGVPVIACMMNNDNGTPYYPAAYSSTIAVGATDTDNERASPFSWGGGSSYGSHINICAPGNYIYGLSYNSNTNYSSYWGGTSQATPHVTGVVSLLKGIDQTLTVDSILALLIAGAVDQVGDPVEDTPGWDPFHGEGLLNAYNTILLAMASRATACDSFVWAANGETYYASGTYWDTIATGSCDSVAVLNLSLTNSTSGTDSITACGNYTWPVNSMNYSSTGTYIATIPNAVGCDSVITLELTIDSVLHSTVNESHCDSFYWSATGMTYINTGMYSDTLVGASGCDSIVTLDLIIEYTVYRSDTVTACVNYTWPFNGMTYSSNLVVTDTVSYMPCDSIGTLNLTIINNASSSDSVTACDSYIWQADGNTYTTSGPQTATFVAANGCDSVVTLNLTINTVDASASQISSTELAANLGGALYQWLNCDGGFDQLIGEINQSYITTTNGHYAVEVRDNGCVDTSACFSISAVGILQNDFGEKFKLFPNPTSDRIIISLGIVVSHAEIQIFDMSGNLVNREEIRNSDQGTLTIDGAAGSYFVDIRDDTNRRARIKVLKK